MAEFVERDEFTQSLERVHTRIDKIAETGIKIETAAEMMEKSVNDMHTIIYGREGKDGMVSKVYGVYARINIQWWLLSTIILGLFGTAWIIMQNVWKR
jgi:hypothetical protein